jgi:hypothetical protein
MMATYPCPAAKSRKKDMRQDFFGGPCQWNNYLSFTIFRVCDEDAV